MHAAEAARAGGPPLPAGFAGNGSAGALGSTYPNGFAWSTALERLLFHEATWPIILELTGGEPWMQGAVTLYDDFSRGNAHAMGGFLHCKRDAQKRNPDALTSAPDGYTEPVYCRAREDGTVESDNFVVFPYFDDVGPDDGGIFLLPGSHKSPLARPETLFGSIGQTGSKVAGRDFGANAWVAHDAAWDDSPEAHDLIPGERPVDMKVPEGCIKPEFKAGDILILPEATLHCVVPWRADGRTRRALMLRHDFQHRAPVGLLLFLFLHEMARRRGKFYICLPKITRNDEKMTGGTQRPGGRAGRCGPPTDGRAHELRTERSHQRWRHFLCFILTQILLIFCNFYGWI